MEGFYLGESVPVNQKLSDIFLQLHISARSGRGVPKIIDVYGKDVFDFRENSIAVTIPFNWVNKVGDKKGLNARRTQILKEMRNNPNITQEQLVDVLGVSLTTVENNIRYLKKNGFIERVGTNKSGYWKVIE